MIVIASSSFIVRKGLTDILKELYTGRKIFGIDSAKELNKFIEQNKIALLLVSNKILLEVNLSYYKEIQVIKMIDSRPDFMDTDSTNSELLFLDENENSIMHILKRNLALMEKDSSKNKNESELSDRELDIVREVALGKTNKEIADKLFISVHTVITHRKNITRKLGIKTVSGLTVYALLNKLIKMGDNI